MSGTTTFLSLHNFVAETRDYFDRGAVHAFEAFMNSSRLYPEDIEQYASFHPEHHTRNLVYRDADMAILLLCWDIGQQSAIHNHDGQSCWARVEQGQLMISSYALIKRDPLQVSLKGKPVVLSTGELELPNPIHRMTNLADWSTRAVSLHVYRKPLDACEVYDLERGTATRIQLSIDADLTAV